MGRASAKYHVPGTRLDGGQILATEKIITIDDLLVSDKFIYMLDEAKNHYDVRSQYSFEQGQALAIAMDRHVLQVGVKAARSDANIPGAQGTPGGHQIYATDEGLGNDVNFLGNPESLARALYKAAQIFDDKFIPDDGQRYFFCRPEQFYMLVQSDKAINRDFGGVGSYSDGTVFRVAGINVVKCTTLPKGVINESPEQGDGQEKYSGDFTNTVGLFWHPSAVGTVKLLDLAMEMEYSAATQGTLMVAKYAMGHDVLRPEAAIELVDAARPEPAPEVAPPAQEKPAAQSKARK